MNPELIIMVGNIASGKSTYIEKFLVEQDEQDKQYLVVSKDAIRRMFGGGGYLFDEKLESLVHDCIIEIIRNLMYAKANIIIDETNMRIATRLPFIKLADSFFYDKIALIVPEVSLEESLKRRCGDADSAWGYSKEVWAEVWNRKKNNYEEPTEEEGFNKIIRI